jgi:hypothetical protein
MPLTITPLFLVSGMYRIVLIVIFLKIMPLMCGELTGIQSISVLTFMALTMIALDSLIRGDKIP